MDPEIKVRRNETHAHEQLKRLAFVWAQSQGFSACAMEVSLPRCRYRADVAAYRVGSNDAGSTAIFECKQALPDLRRDNCQGEATRQRLETVCRRRLVLEKHLRIHFPNLRIADSLFPEFDSHNFQAIQHRGYTRVLRELGALQNRLYDCTKFEKLIRYRCANLFFLVLPRELFRESEIPVGWGTLVRRGDELRLERKPTYYENSGEARLRFLQRIAAAGTRLQNKQLEIRFEDVMATRGRSFY